MILNNGSADLTHTDMVFSQDSFRLFVVYSEKHELRCDFIGLKIDES